MLMLIDTDWCRRMLIDADSVSQYFGLAYFWLVKYQKKATSTFSFQLCRWGHLGKLQRWKARDQGVSYQSKLAEDCCNQDTYAEQHRHGHAELQNIPECTEKCHLDAIPTIEGNPAAIARPMYTQFRGQHSHGGGGTLHSITHNPPS